MESENLFDFKKVSKEFYDFFNEEKKDEIKSLISEGINFINIDFFEIAKFNPDLSQKLLTNTKDCFIICDEVLKGFFENFEDSRKLKFRLKSLPQSNKIQIRNIRSENLEKIVLIEGQIRRKTDVRPRLKETHYLCQNPGCSYYEDKIIVPQIEEKIKVLKTCPKCKSSLSEVGKILVDAQTIVLEEIAEHLENQADQPKRINILLEEDLVSPFKDNKINPGSRVRVVGIVKEIPRYSKTGAESVNFEIVVLANYIEALEDDLTEINISKKEEDKIIELSKKDNVVEILVNNFAPSMYGHNKIKESIILQLFGGSREVKGDGVVVRGDIHILLVGDPGVAKSQILKAASKIAPRSSFVSGKSASGVGLTATVVRDDLQGGWALEAGALVLANGGVACIDEMDKMSDDDTSAMHEALEQQTISVAKANIRATLRCETTVLGAANPKFGRFDSYADIAKQIDFPPALLSRFDLIFVLRDKPDKKKDSLIAQHILETHKDKSKTKTELDPDFIRKYLAYSKRITPKLTDEAITKIREFYISMRNTSDDEDENQVKPVPITARQLEALIRISQAYAKIKLDNFVRGTYVDRAVDILIYCLKKIGLDPKTGEIDIDKITSGITQSSRNQYRAIQEVIEKLEVNKSEIIYEDICEEAKKIDINNNDVKKVLRKLKEEGIIFEPKKGVFKKLM